MEPSHKGNQRNLKASKVLVALHLKEVPLACLSNLVASLVTRKVQVDLVVVLQLLVDLVVARKVQVDSVVARKLQVDLVVVLQLLVDLVVAHKLQVALEAQHKHSKASEAVVVALVFLLLAVSVHLLVAQKLLHRAC